MFLIRKKHQKDGFPRRIWSIALAQYIGRTEGAQDTAAFRTQGVKDVQGTYVKDGQRHRAQKPERRVILVI